MSQEDDELARILELSRQEYERDQERFRSEQAKAERLFAHQADLRRENAQQRELTLVRRLSLRPPPAPTPYLGLRTSHSQRAPTAPDLSDLEGVEIQIEYQDVNDVPDAQPVANQPLRASIALPNAPPMAEIYDMPLGGGQMFPGPLRASLQSVSAPVRLPGHHTHCMGMERHFDATASGGLIYLCALGIVNGKRDGYKFQVGFRYNNRSDAERPDALSKAQKGLTNFWFECALYQNDFNAPGFGDFEIVLMETPLFSTKQVLTAKVQLADLVRERNGVTQVYFQDRSYMQLRFFVSSARDVGVPRIEPLDTFRIVTDRTIFTAQERVTGVVTYTVRANSKEVSSITLAARAGVSVHSRKNGRNNLIFDYYGQLNHEVELLVDRELQPGIHSWKFSYELPRNIAPTDCSASPFTDSICGNSGVEGRIILHRKKAKFCFRPIRVVRQPMPLVPEIIEIPAERNSWCTVTVSRGPYTFGSTCVVRLRRRENPQSTKGHVTLMCRITTKVTGNGQRRVTYAMSKRINISEHLESNVDVPINSQHFQPKGDFSNAYSMAFAYGEESVGSVEWYLEVHPYRQPKVDIPIQVVPNLDDPLLRILPLEPDLPPVIQTNDVQFEPFQFEPTDVLAQENGWALDAGLLRCASTQLYAYPENGGDIKIPVEERDWSANRKGRWLK